MLKNAAWIITTAAAATVTTAAGAAVSLDTNDGGSSSAPCRATAPVAQGGGCCAGQSAGQTARKTAERNPAASHVVLASNTSIGLTLDAIKKLAGEWVRVDEEGTVTDEVVSSYRVTAGGSAVLEILFPGTEHEMVTVYHQNGDALMLTHYCVLGNQPQMRVATGATPGTYSYQCNGHGTNMKTENDKHMHQGMLTFKSPDHYTTEWSMTENGEITFTASYEVVRRKAEKTKKVAGTVR